MTTIAKSQRTSWNLPWLIGLGLLAVLGLVAWIIQLTQGFDVIGVGQNVVWGVYIAAFFTLAGIAGGLVILTSLSDLGVIPDLSQYRRRMLIGALACFIASGILILMDIGQPVRVFYMVISANGSSPFVWDFASLILSVIVTITYLYTTPKKWLSVLTGIVAGLVVLVEGMILSMSVAGVLWHGGMMPVIFLVDGILGAAVVMLIAQADQKVSGFFTRVALALLPVLVVLHAFEIATLRYAGPEEARASIMLILSGSLAPLFWTQVVLGMVIPFVLLLFVPRQRIVSQIAAVLVILGILVTKLVLLTSGQALPFMQAEALYTPSWVELGGVIGAISLAGLLYILGNRAIVRE